MLTDLANGPLPSAEELAALVKNKQQEKWDLSRMTRDIDIVIEIGVERVTRLLEYTLNNSINNIRKVSKHEQN